MNEEAKIGLSVEKLERDKRWRDFIGSPPKESVPQTGISDNPLSPLYVEPLTDAALKRSSEDFHALGDALCGIDKALQGAHGGSGWVCPVCGRGVAPGVPICPCQPGAPYNFPPPQYPEPWWKPLFPPSEQVPWWNPNRSPTWDGVAVYC